MYQFCRQKQSKQSNEKEGGTESKRTENRNGNHRDKMESIRLSSMRTASLQTDCRTNTKQKSKCVWSSSHIVINKVIGHSIGHHPSGQGSLPQRNRFQISVLLIRHGHHLHVLA